MFDVITLEKKEQIFRKNVREITEFLNDSPEFKDDPDIKNLFSLCDSEGTILLERLSKDLKLASKSLADYESRYLVDLYYTVQKFRIRINNQLFQIKEQGGQEPNKMLVYIFDNFVRLEAQIQRALQYYCESSTFGQWLISQVGVGCVIGAGIMAHTNVKVSASRSGYLRYAGLDPSCSWLGAEKAADLVRETLGTKRDITLEDVYLCAQKANRNGDLIVKQMIALDKPSVEEEGQQEQSAEYKLKRKLLVDVLAKRPWNAALKTLYTFKAGESFIKTQNSKNAVYGQIYVKRKVYEVNLNDQFAFKQQAEQILATKNIGKTTEAYKHLTQGKLPPAHVHARARRYAAKIFASHAWQVAYEIEFDRPAPEPYPIAHLGHQDFIAPPNWPMQ